MLFLSKTRRYPYNNYYNHDSAKFDNRNNSSHIRYHKFHYINTYDGFNTNNHDNTQKQPHSWYYYTNHYEIRDAFKVNTHDTIPGNEKDTINADRNSNHKRYISHYFWIFTEIEPSYESLFNRHCHLLNSPCFH